MILTSTEHESRDVLLDRETAAWLRQMHSPELDVLDMGDGRYRLTPGSYVGCIVGPGIELHIRPKCGTRNLFYLLSYAYRLARIRKELVQLEQVDDVHEFLIEILAGQLESLLSRGLRREYLEREEQEPVLRGRLLLDRLVRRSPGTELLLPVRFEEFTTDVPVNRVFRFTLESVPGPRNPQLRGRLSRCLRALGTVTRQRFTPDSIDAFTYTRLNQQYESPHQICRLLLEAHGLEGRTGSRPLATFLIDMNKVFERFVTEWLTEEVDHRLFLRSQMHRHLDRTRELEIRPDIVLERLGSPVALADTKYKWLEKGRPRMEDAYQVLAYCRAFGLHEGTLIYLDRESSVRSFPVVDGETTLHCQGIDLTGGVSAIEAGMRRVADHLIRQSERERRRRSHVA